MFAAESKSPLQISASIFMQFSIVNPPRWNIFCSNESFPRSAFALSVPSPYECGGCMRWRFGNYPRRRQRRSLRLRVSSSDRNGALNYRERIVNTGYDGGGGVSYPLVEVIGIGSRKDAVLRSCLESPFQLLQSVRCWNIQAKDSLNIQLEERLLETDPNPRCLEASQFLQTCSQAIILVASAGYGLDRDAAVNILKTVKSRNGFAVAIVVNPFSFEGKRRQDEVKTLIQELQEHTDFYIDIPTDMLLKKDLVTLDEALRTANTAVSLAITAISLFVSPQETLKKLIDGPHDNVKRIVDSDILKNLKNLKEAKIGFGVGRSIRESLLQALYDCPFIGTGIEESSEIVFCVIISSDIVEDEGLCAALHIFRQTVEFTGKVVVTSSHEPNLEPNTLVSAVIVASSPEGQTLPKKNFFSALAEHFPSILKFFMRNQLSDDNVSKTGNASQTVDSLHASAVGDEIPLNGMTNVVDEWGEEDNETVFSGLEEDFDLRDGSGEEDLFNGSSDFSDQINEGTIAFQRELLLNGNLGLGHQIAEKWANQRARAIPSLDNLSIFPLPVGVRRPEDSRDFQDNLHAEELPETKEENGVQEQLDKSSISSLGALTDAGFLAVRDFYSNASTLLKGRNELSRKQGGLAVRAASMLESERDAPKKWSPVTEMQYRGGVYKGRCQGGLPEGKGRLLLDDGSIYDGMWRYGKRSGLGAFYFSNGDVFQGSWRDDVMHGKGWFYFHTGDRWFANFWKGKANGESRFYSKFGDVFFGQFEDGWRHGDFLCINVDGTRCVEVWNKGLLVSRKPLDSDNNGE